MFNVQAIITLHYVTLSYSDLVTSGGLLVSVLKQNNQKIWGCREVWMDWRSTVVSNLESVTVEKPLSSPGADVLFFLIITRALYFLWDKLTQQRLADTLTHLPLLTFSAKLNPWTLGLIYNQPERARGCPDLSLSSSVESQCLMYQKDEIRMKIVPICDKGWTCLLLCFSIAQLYFL